MTDLLTTVSILFILAGPFLLVANQFELPTVPFLIIAGIVAGFFIDEGQTLELAQFGIALLVFTFGVELEIRNFQPVLGDSEIAALGQILGVGILGLGLGLLFALPVTEAAILGISVALSSTIVGTALLEDEIRQNIVRGRLAETIQLVQDLLAIFILLVLGAGTFAADPIAAQIGYGVSLLIVAMLVNRYLFDLIGRLAGDSDELMIIGVVSILVLFIIAAEAAGVSIVIGAFAAGVAVRHDPAQYLGLFNGLTSIKDFFAAIFFVTVGALVVLPFVEIGPAASVEKIALVAGLVVLTAILKPAVTTAVLIYQGYEARSATLTSLSIDQVSEFALIIAIEALILGVLTQEVFDAIILAAAVTMITSSLTQRHNERIYRSLSDRGLITSNHRKIDELSSVPEGYSDHIIIVGYGRKGQELASTCDRLDREFIVIENDPALLDAVRSDCDAYVFGDSMEPYTWEKANVSEAKLVASTVNSEPVSNRLLSFEFEADLMLRTDDVWSALDYIDRGALYVSISDLLAGERLVTQLRSLFEDGVSPEQLQEEHRDELEEYRAVIKQREDRSLEGKY